MADNFAVNQYERLLPVKISYDGGEVDVSSALTTLSIKEDIFMSSMSCKMAVVDTSDSLGVVDFDGTETFKISFKSLPEDDRVISITFRIFRVDIAVDEQKNDIKVYTLYGVTPEHFTQSSMDINQSYNMPINEAVQAVYDKLGSKRKIDIHRTTGTYTYIVPGMTPFESMSFFQRRAYDAKYRASLFSFYETVDGYNFKNIERTIDENRNKAIVYKYSPTAAVKDKNPQFSIESLNIPTNKDVLEKIKSGAYANAVREIDLFNQRVNSTEVRIREDFKTFVHLDDTAMSLDSKAIIDEHLNEINSTKWINNIGVDDKRKELIPRRKFYLDCLSQVSLNCIVPGNSNLSVGQVIDLDMLELAGFTEDKIQEPKISGKYLITRVTHLIEGQVYKCVINCSKESYRANVPRPEKSIIFKQGKTDKEAPRA